MRRSSGIAVIAAAAVLGVTSAVVVGADGRLGPHVGSSAHTTGSTSSPGVTGSGSSAPTTTTTPASPTDPATPVELSGAPLTATNLLQLDDFERAGWSTANLKAQNRPGDGPGLAGTCRAQPLSTLPGGGGAIFGSYLGRTTNAYESAATFATQEQALAAYTSVVTWFHQCAAGTLPGHLGRAATIGPDVQVNLDTEYDRALWVRISGDGFDGAGGVALVGRRVALFHDEDHDPAVQTVNSLMTAVAIRLT